MPKNLFAFSTSVSSISAPVIAISKPYPIIPKALPVRILKTRATRAVAALPAMMVSVLTKKGRQLSVRAALPNSVIQSAKFVIFPAYPSPRLNLFRLDDISDSFTDSRAAAIAARSFALNFLLMSAWYFSYVFNASSTLRIFLPLACPPSLWLTAQLLHHIFLKLISGTLL